jgi:hypothetical protein
MEKEQMMARLLAEIRADNEEVMVPIRTNREEMKEEMNAYRKEMKAYRVATKACPEKIEPNPVEIKTVAEHQEVPKKKDRSRVNRTTDGAA